MTTKVNIGRQKTSNIIGTETQKKLWNNNYERQNVTG